MFIPESDSKTAEAIYHFEDEEKELKNIDLCKRNLITNLKNRTKDLSKS
ncbi:hypothetical protein Tco_0502642, partial [Tanacetum coccineum]